MSDLSCSKKHRTETEVLFTVRVKSWVRSWSISESCWTAFSNLLCSPSPSADAAVAMIAAGDCHLEPLCGVPRNTTPVRDLMMPGKSSI